MDVISLPEVQTVLQRTIRRSSCYVSVVLRSTGTCPTSTCCRGSSCGMCPTRSSSWAHAAPSPVWTRRPPRCTSTAATASGQWATRAGSATGANGETGEGRRRRENVKRFAVAQSWRFVSLLQVQPVRQRVRSVPPCGERTVCVVSGLQPRRTPGAHHELAQEQRTLPCRLWSPVWVHLKTRQPVTWLVRGRGGRRRGPLKFMLSTITWYFQNYLLQYFYWVSVRPLKLSQRPPAALVWNCNWLPSSGNTATLGVALLSFGPSAKLTLSEDRRRRNGPKWYIYRCMVLYSADGGAVSALGTALSLKQVNESLKIKILKPWFLSRTWETFGLRAPPVRPSGGNVAV